jgi:hypothetical protein
MSNDETKKLKKILKRKLEPTWVNSTNSPLVIWDRDKKIGFSKEWPSKKTNIK